MNPNTKSSVDSFRRMSFITVVAVYFLIRVGGIVRSTGSGMGCPDWPMCFGSVIPPTDVSQLPVNYQEVYLELRLAKNERFTATLEKLGFKETANLIANDKFILIEEEFNATKTWIEYINRLIGVVVGLFILLTVWKSFKLWKVDKWIPIHSILSLVLVLFTGWIGSIVVSTNLLPWMITFHMLLALALVAVLLYVNHRSQRLHRSQITHVDVPAKIQWILILGTVLMLVQIVLGTQVREQLDKVAFDLGGLLREEWVEKSGAKFLIHRSFSLVILALHLVYFYWAYRFSPRNSKVIVLSQLLFLVLLLEITSGVGMAYFGIPAFLQPIHLLLGSLLVGIQLLLILQFKDHIRIKLNTN